MRMTPDAGKGNACPRSPPSTTSRRRGMGRLQEGGASDPRWVGKCGASGRSLSGRRPPVKAMTRPEVSNSWITHPRNDMPTAPGAGYRARSRRAGRMDRWQRAAYIAWGIIVLAGVGRAALYHLPRHCGCYDVFADGGRHWLAAEPVYDLDHP